MTVSEAFFKQQRVVFWINVKNSAMKNALSLNFWRKSELLVKSKIPVILRNVTGKLHHVVSIYLCGFTAFTPPYFLVCFTFT